MAKLRIFAVNLCRLLLALTFILSGYVKAIDPLGTQYKLKDYAAAMHLAEYIPDWLTLTGAITLAMTEFALGIFMLFAIRRHLVSKLVTALMVVMTLITVWIF
ncbi:MAG: triose-phosphate isomerase, partial [Prevotella sp.]|nr:triose-phosphate isomerase [Prevotella sp.]